LPSVDETPLEEQKEDAAQKPEDEK